MSMLDSPLEGLAVNYVTFGILTIVNNLWTWITVITAAVSFWSVRTAGATSCSVKSEHISTWIDQGSSVSSQPNPEGHTSDSDNKPSSASATAAALSPSVCNDGVTKGKFTVYYEEAEVVKDGESDGELTAVEEWENGEVGECGEWWESWERVLRTRTGDNGWYWLQDTTALNGSVVRLWDEWRRQRYSSSCAVW